MTIDYEKLDNQIVFAAVCMPNEELAEQVIAWSETLHDYTSKRIDVVKLTHAHHALIIAFLEYFKTQYMADLMNVEIPPDESED